MNAEKFVAGLSHFIKSPKFVRAYPYYAHVLAKLVPVPNTTIATMAVSRHRGVFYLHVNVDFFVRSPQFLTGILLHEVHHIVMGHLTHPRFADPGLPNLMTIAMEVSANEYIREKLPGRPITWVEYQSLGLKPGQSTKERYEILVQHKKSNRWEPPPCECVDDHLAGGGLKQDEKSSVFDGGRGQADVESLIETALRSVDETGAAADGSAKLGGKDPGFWIERVRPPSATGPRCFVDWKLALRNFISQRRHRVPNYLRLNRRFPKEIGVVPGRRYSTTSLNSRLSLLVAIDTSASMSGPDLDEIACHLRKLQQMVDMTIVECDTMIHRTYPFEGSLEQVHGRGGTDLRPVFEETVLGHDLFDGIVYFTDGCGPFPEAPSRLPTLWVLTDTWEFPCPWGERAVFGEPHGGKGRRLPRRPRRVYKR